MKYALDASVAIRGVLTEADSPMIIGATSSAGGSTNCWPRRQLENIRVDWGRLAEDFLSEAVKE